MSEYINQLQERGNSLANKPKLLKKFCSKLDSFSHAPTKKKALEKLLPFVADTALVDLLNDHLLDYYQQKNQFLAEGSFRDYDVISVWYTIGLLLQTSSPVAAIDTIIDNMIAQQHEDLFLARRIINLLHDPCYQTTLEKVEKYYLGINEKAAAYIWAKQLGVELPTHWDWQLSFRLLGIPNPEKIVTDLVDHLYLRVELYAPRGNGESFTIDLRDKNYKISHFWKEHKTDNPTKIRQNSQQEIPLKQAPNLEQLIEFITELEAIYGFQFERTLDYSYFSRGIKKKTNIQKWLLKN